MNYQVLYDSIHGHSKKVALKLSNDAVKVSFQTKITLDYVIFVCPTYGDEELPYEMEEFLQNIEIFNKNYTICELGNYYGFENFGFGATKLIEWELKKRKWKNFYFNFSLDSLPTINWAAFSIWEKGLQNALSNFS